MRPIGIGLDGGYIVELDRAEWEGLRELQRVVQAADEGDLGDGLRAVRAFLEARMLAGDLRLLARRFEGLMGDPLPEGDHELVDELARSSGGGGSGTVQAEVREITVTRHPGRQTGDHPLPGWAGL